MNLREKKKKEIKEKIIKVSKEIFFNTSYEKTTIEEIAQKADIGVGTVYNYFNSKADILICIAEKEIDIEGVSYILSEEDLKKSVADIIVDFSWKSLGNLKILSKRIWKELIRAMINSSKSNNLILNGFMKIDLNYIKNLEQLLENLKNKGLLKSNFDSSTASMVLYNNIMALVIQYIFSDTLTKEEAKNIYEKYVLFIIENKTNRE